MKVIEDGPDIPDELVSAQERGQTLFICGAGVSLGAGLPTFRGLVGGVYEHLHEQWQHHHAEREGMENGGRLYGQYDRVLRSLERRLGGPNPRRNRRMRSKIRSAVRAQLQPPPEPDLSNHLALFDLSCDEIGNSRILTTNFDTLFERAVKSSRGTPPPSHSGVALPQPKSPNFDGVLHLHGRLADADLNLEETDLVLTSAEFGDAYLRTGWASRYVYDLVRTHTVVLVGYQADDPPMRYLLEALEANRERYLDLKRVYAFAPSEPGEDTLESELWRAKGVEPIIYRNDGGDHSRLYDSLREWQSYSTDPTRWRQSRLEAIFANTLEKTNESVRNECVRLLSHHDATELLGALSPDPEWLPFLTSKGVFKSGTAHLGLWAASRVAEPEIIRQVAGATVLDDTSRWPLERALEKTNPDLKNVFRRAWRLIIRESIASTMPLSRNGWFEIEPQLKLGEVGYSERATITGIFKPQLRVEKPYRFREEQEDLEHHSLRTLVRIDFTSGDYPHPEKVLLALPSQPEMELELLFSLDRALLDSLEEAHDVGFLDGWDAANGDVPSVAPHTQNTNRSGFYPIVRMIADLWLRLLVNNPIDARTIAMRWDEGRWPLLKRLWLFAAESDLFSPDEVANALFKTDDADFWISNTVVEVMRAMRPHAGLHSPRKNARSSKHACATVYRDRCT